jgi:hypothetical protein
VNHAAGCALDGASITAQIERFSDAGFARARAVLMRLASTIADAM